jgi:hypothetical protein
MAITREWIEDEVVKLENELLEAEILKITKLRRLGEAKREYDNACESVGELRGCIEGLKNELRFITGEDEPG